MIVIFIGPPGAGKGTQAALLASKLDLPFISVGHLLREAYQKGTFEGRQWWENYGRRGLNAPIELKFKIVTEALNQAKGGSILEGFPKTEQDLNALRNYLDERQLKIDRVFHIIISEKTAFQRILARKARGETRSDDNLELLNTRFEKGYRQDLPVILDYFRRLNILEEINGEQDIHVIHEEILKRLDIND